MNTCDNQAVDTLLAYEEIRRLALTYCRGIDRRDIDLVEECYVPGATDEHGMNPTRTAAEFFTMLRQKPGSTMTQHNITNHLIQLLDHEHAEGEAYLVAYHWVSSREGERRLYILGGRYLDRYVKKDGAWKIHHRQVVADWTKYLDAEEPSDAPQTAGMAYGARGQADPSNAFFKAPAWISTNRAA
jgi:hypothetical protein